MTVLSRADKAHIRASAARIVLEKTDRILGPDVRVVFEEHGKINAPAFTDGKTITINTSFKNVEKSLEEGFTPSTMMLTTGLNYHELAHCLFTPRLDSPLIKEVRNRNLFQAMNILEDQLAETRFVKRYENSRHYFTALVTNYMMENDQYLKANYPLVSGRLFLPQRFRDAFKNAYTKPENIDRIDDLVAEYKKQIWPKDSIEMLRLIEEFDALLKADQDNGGPSIICNHELGNGKPDTSMSEQLVEVEEYENTDSGSESDEGEDDEDDAGAGDEDESDSEPDEGEEEDTKAASPGGSGGSDSGDNEEQHPDPKQILVETMEDLTEELSEELEDRIESVRDHERDYRVDIDRDPPHYRSVLPEDTLCVNRCVDEFREVEQQHAPGWHVNQRSGKLNHRAYNRALRGDEYVFRRWKEGVHDALDFEVVLCIDQSGSMSGRIDMASTALWVLKRTFEECDGVVTVLGFSDECMLLEQRGDPASPARVPEYGVIGGTVVADTLKEANRILGASQKPLKMCVVISDGGFHDMYEAEALVPTLVSPVTFIGINHGVSYWEGKPNVVHTQTIDEPMQLVDVVKNLALRLSDERLTARTKG